MRRKSRPWSRTIETGILRTLGLATQSDIDLGLHWYQTAHDEARAIAERNNVSVSQVCGVIAALSPGLAWGKNCIQAEQLIRAWVSGEPLPIVGVYGRKNVDKARRILAGDSPPDVLNGRKTSSFYQNILDSLNPEPVTIDRHAKALAYGLKATRAGYASNDKLSLVKDNEYEFIAWHYRIIAGRLGFIPSQLQAICWCTWKRVNESRDND